MRLDESTPFSGWTANQSQLLCVRANRGPLRVREVALSYSKRNTAVVVPQLETPMATSNVGSIGNSWQQSRSGWKRMYVGTYVPVMECGVKLTSALVLIIVVDISMNTLWFHESCAQFSLFAPVAESHVPPLPSRQTKKNMQACGGQHDAVVPGGGQAWRGCDRVRRPHDLGWGRYLPPRPPHRRIR